MCWGRSFSDAPAGGHADLRRPGDRRRAAGADRHAKYRTALQARPQRARPPRRRGDVSRQGFEFVGEIYDSTKKARLLPFSFSVDQTYVLPLEDETTRVISNGGFVLEAELIVTGISQATQAVVTVPDHGWVVGDDIYFTGILGMTQINGRYGRIISVTDANNVVIDFDTTGFDAFTGATGGVAGADQPDPPPVDPPDLPPYVPIDPPIITEFPIFGYQWF
jgi:hypothetical protein